MAATPTPAPPQTIKGINQYGNKKSISVLDPDEVSMSVDSISMRILLESILDELKLIRFQLQIITDEKIDVIEVE